MMERFGRAMECAEKFGSCRLDKMEELARELEEFNGSVFETEDYLKEKEIQDRKDVAEILRMQINLRLRMDQLKAANLFAYDVHEMETAYPEDS